MIICTWNRCDLLRQTLQSMSYLQVPPGFDWELVIVNNNSTDDTEAVIRSFESALPVRYVIEQLQGHSHSRNRGLTVATGELIVWTDDDVLVEPDLLITWYNAATRWPDAAYFAGRVDPWFETLPPLAMRTALPPVNEGFCGIDLGPDERRLAPGEGPKGANMAFRRRAVSGLRFDPSLGIIGGVQRRGDETDYCEQVRRQGGYGVWVPSVRLRHFVPASRLTLDYIKAFYQGLGETWVRCHRPSGRQFAGVAGWLWRRYLAANVSYLMALLSFDPIRRYRAKADLWRMQGVIHECQRSSRLSIGQLNLGDTPAEPSRTPGCRPV